MRRPPLKLTCGATRSKEKSHVENTRVDNLRVQQHAVFPQIGVLQAGLIEFEPALPKAKQEAIEQLHIGVVEKVLFEFTEEGFAELERQGLSHAMLVPPSGWESSGDGSTGGLLDDVCEVYRLPGKMFLLGWVVGKGLGKEIGDASDGHLCEELRRVMTRLCTLVMTRLRTLVMMRLRTLAMTRLRTRGDMIAR